MRRIWWLAAVVVVLAAGCADDDPDTADAVADGFRTELEAHGHVVVPLRASEGGLLGEGVAWWCVSDVLVGVHAYGDVDTLEDDAERLEDPAFLAVLDFAAPPTFYVRDRLIVEAIGVHDGLAPTLVDLLGPPLDVRPFGFEPTQACDEAPV